MMDIRTFKLNRKKQFRLPKYDEPAIRFVKNEFILSEDLVEGGEVCEFFISL